jgi:hypothetical protein
LTVADASLVAYLIIAGERMATAHAVWEADSEWMLPRLWRGEFERLSRQAFARAH